ncbi:MAG TPA: TonB family protein [Bryobacteraceae bacterium]|nr:TonB family protein [Bryobacteraceae bacterium]
MIFINPMGKPVFLLSFCDHLPACKKKVRVLVHAQIVEFARSARRRRFLVGEQRAITASEPRAFQFLLVGLSALVIGCLIAGLATIHYQKFAQLVRSQARSETSPTLDLSLQAERQGADLRVSWDRTTVMAARAQSGLLRIQDGDSRQQQLHLDPAQLRTGSVLYTPVTNNVQFRLEVSGTNRQRASEWILVLAAPRKVEPGVRVAETTEARQPFKTASISAPAFYAVQVGSFRNRANAERLRAKMEARYGPSRLVLHESDPPLWRVLVGNEGTIEGAAMLRERIRAEYGLRAEFRLSALSSPVSGSETLRATPVASSGPAPVVPNAVLASTSPLPTDLPGVAGEMNSIPPDLPLSRQTLLAAKTQAGDFAPPQVVHQVLPEVPRKARDTIQGTVKVRVKLRADQSGDVSAATLDFPGPSRYFARLALQASRHWKFSPATIGNREVPSEWILRFEFVRSSTRVFPVCISRQKS